MGAGADGGAEVDGERADVEAGGAADGDPDSVFFDLEQLDCVRRHLDRVWQWDHDVRVSRGVGLLVHGRRLRARLARQRIAAAARNLLGRECRRLLEESAAAAVECRVDGGAVRPWAAVRRAGRHAQRIAGVGVQAETDRGVVGLVAADEAGQARGAADHERQYAARQRVERAGVTDALLAQGAADAGDDVV